MPTDVLDDPLLKTQGIPQIGSLSTEKCWSAVKKYALEFESEIWKIEDQLKGTGKLTSLSETFYFSFSLRIFSLPFSFNFIRRDVFHINSLKPELNPICYLLALLGAYHFLHVSRIRVKLLTFRLLMSYIYRAPILDVSRSHTTTQHSR